MILKNIIISLASVSIFVSTQVLAKDSECTEAAIAAAEKPVAEGGIGAGSSDMLNCLEVREGFDVVVAWNSSTHHKKTFDNTGQKTGQQVVNAANLVKDYTNNYDMKLGDDYSTVVVAYGAGLGWVLNSSEAVNQTKVNDLLNKGVKIYACQNTMRAKGKTIDDLIDGVEVVPAGVTAVVDFQNQKYVYLMP